MTMRDIGRLTEIEFEKFKGIVRERSLKVGGPSHAHEQVRKLVIARKRAQRKNLTEEPFQKKESPLLDALHPNRVYKRTWRPLRERKKTQDIDLEVFSFIDRPEETLEKFIAIAEAECGASEIRLNFGDGVCYDMSPYLVLSMLRNDIPSRLLRRGTITRDVTKVLDSVGLLAALKIVPRWHGYEPANDSDDFCIMPFNLRSGGGIDPEQLATSMQRDEKVANEFVDTLQDWIRRHNPEQTIGIEVKSKIKSMITEILDNALRHGEPETEAGRWHMVGVLQKVTDDHDRVIVVCNLSIVNLGKTIAETVATAPENVLKDVNAYASMHSSSFSRDTLLTVSALQDKISRIHPLPGNKSSSLNGIGLMTTILTILNPLFSCPLEEYQPSLTILSGSAWLRAGAPYNPKAGKYGTRTLAFNQSNDMSLPPDPERVKTLKRHFPGTIISMRFNIGADKLEKLSV